jgi:hypothetical protein
MDTDYPAPMAYDVNLGRCQKRNRSQLSQLAEYSGLIFQRARIVITSPRFTFLSDTTTSCAL